MDHRGPPCTCPIRGQPGEALLSANFAHLKQEDAGQGSSMQTLLQPAGYPNFNYVAITADGRIIAPSFLTIGGTSSCVHFPLTFVGEWTPGPAVETELCYLYQSAPCPFFQQQVAGNFIDVSHIPLDCLIPQLPIVNQSLPPVVNERSSKKTRYSAHNLKIAEKHAERLWPDQNSNFQPKNNPANQSATRITSKKDWAAHPKNITGTSQPPNPEANGDIFTLLNREGYVMVPDLNFKITQRPPY